MSELTKLQCVVFRVGSGPKISDLQESSCSAAHMNVDLAEKLFNALSGFRDVVFGFFTSSLLVGCLWASTWGMP